MIEAGLLQQLKQFAYWARQAGKYNLAKCSSGNMSQRLDDGTILISESRAWLSNLKLSQIAHVNLSDRKANNQKVPSGELPLHLSILHARTDVNTILHCQSESATALACRDEIITDYNIIIEVPIYIGNVRHLPFLMPGSEDLAQAVAKASMEADLIQLQNHGQVVMGKNYEEVIQKAVFFELACALILKNSAKYSSIKPDDLNMLSNYR